MNIKKQLVRFNEAALPNSFVAIAVGLNRAKVPAHAGIIIRLNNVNYLHHFDGVARIMDDFDTSQWYVYKIVNFIKIDDESEVSSFLRHCRLVCAKSKIVYSCTFDGSYYDADGDFQSASGLPELGTCVGFCLNTLSLYIIDQESFLQLDGWNEDTIPPDFPLDNYGLEQTFESYPQIDGGLYNAFRKRISPLEYLCAGFFDVYPIRKDQIDAIAADVMEVISSKF
ncbi:MAG: hypothetical protein EOO61_15410 [Hymenobacter sp.]|nr:MAG: hypothetical protein EOO61_15410 [Hymenobacter sp.]